MFEELWELQMSDMGSNRITVRIAPELTARLRSRSRVNGIAKSELIREAPISASSAAVRVHHGPIARALSKGWPHPLVAPFATEPAMSVPKGILTLFLL